jgi:uncharacterized protein YkwD
MKNGRLAIATVMMWAALALPGCSSSRLQPPAASAPQPANEPAPASTALNGTAAAQGTQGSALTKAEIESQLLNLINQQREQNGLKPLTISAELERSAQAHSAAMAKGRFVSVRGTGESSLADRFDQAGVRSDSVGENVLSVSATDAKLADQSFTTWMAKDSAQRNLLSSRFERTGFGIERSSGAVGEAYVTEDFAH